MEAQKEGIYKIYNCEWEGIAIEVRHCANWYGSKAMDLLVQHVEVRSIDKTPLPISETGYKSIFLTQEDPLREFDHSAIVYVLHLLNEVADCPEWKKQQKANDQFELF